MGERIAKILQEKGIKKIRMAEALNVSPAYVTDLCAGRKTPSDRTIADICRVYGVSETWLRSGEGEMFEELDPDEELMRFVGTITKDDAHPLNRLARILAHLPPEGIELISQAVEYLLDREQSQK